jgi:hypothetical protein
VFALQSLDPETILTCMLGQRNMEGSLVTPRLQDHVTPPKEARKQVPGSCVVLRKVATRVGDPERDERTNELGGTT